MSGVEITVTGGEYEHTRGIDGFSDGGVRVRYVARPVREIFSGMLEARAFEACEFSLANYITLRGRGDGSMRAIPVFPSRVFRHNLAVTRRDSALSSLADLNGARIGVEDYSMTAAVWFRALLADEYGVDLDSIAWVTREKQRFDIPAGARVERTSADLEELLIEGSLDALLGMHLKDNALPPDQRRLRTVLADPDADARAYFERTGIHPIMHVVVVRTDVLERAPRAPGVIAAAFERGKAPVVEKLGRDPLPYGLGATNRKVVGRLAQALREQGFIDRVPDVDELFVS